MEKSELPGSSGRQEEEEDGQASAAGGPARRRKRNKNKKKDPAELMNSFVRKMHGADPPAVTPGPQPSGQSSRNKGQSFNANQGQTQKKGSEAGKHGEMGSQKSHASQAQQASQPALSKEQHQQRARGGGAQLQQPQ